MDDESIINDETFLDESHPNSLGTVMLTVLIVKEVHMTRLSERIAFHVQKAQSIKRKPLCFDTQSPRRNGF